SLSLSAEHRIDAVCARFEAACKAGERPCLEDHLGQVEAAERHALLRELLRLELFYRVRAGETPNLDEYRLRFPDKVELLLSRFAGLDPAWLAGALAEGGGTGLPRSELLGTTSLALEDGVPPELAEHPRYQVQQRLGAGGMGVVFKAEHRLM